MLTRQHTHAPKKALPESTGCRVTNLAIRMSEHSITNLAIRMSEHSIMKFRRLRPAMRAARRLP